MPTIERTIGLIHEHVKKQAGRSHDGKTHPQARRRRQFQLPIGFPTGPEIRCARLSCLTVAVRQIVSQHVATKEISLFRLAPAL